MQALLLLTLVHVFGFVFGDKICAVYDEHGNKIGSGPHFMGTFPKDAKPGDILPGRLRLENFGAATLRSGTCKSDYVKPNLVSNSLELEVTEKFDPEGTGIDGCMFVLRLEKSDGCSDTVATEFELVYRAREDVPAPIFSKENYTFKMSFPVPKGTTINEEDITVTNLNFSSVRLELQDPFDGIESVRLDTSTDTVHRFRLRTTKLLYLLEDLNLMLVAKGEPGEITTKVAFTLRMNEDSALPTAEFEKSFYDVSVQASELNPRRNIHPTGMIKLKEKYSRLSLDVHALNGDYLRFEVAHEVGSRDVDVRLVEFPKTNLTSQDIFLQVRARLTNIFGYESDGFAFLLVRVIGNPECLAHVEVENKEQIAMIVLSIVVFILVLVIIYLYFKYVRGRKPALVTEVPVATGSTVRHRRPTPWKISEYPHPLDRIHTTLATLSEAEEESKDGESDQSRYLQIKVVKDEVAVKPIASTRKRSVTFVESDEEARRIREAEDVIADKMKLSQEGERRSSREEVAEERRRRKSSAKMYRCLT